MVIYTSFHIIPQTNVVDKMHHSNHPIYLFSLLSNGQRHACIMAFLQMNIFNLLIRFPQTTYFVKSCIITLSMKIQKCNPHKITNSSILLHRNQKANAVTRERIMYMETVHHHHWQNYLTFTLQARHQFNFYAHLRRCVMIVY